MSASISDNLVLIFSTSSVQPFSSTSSFDFISLIFPRTDSISLTFSLICSKFFCADWNLSILMKIDSLFFCSEWLVGLCGCGVVGDEEVIDGASTMDACFGSSGIMFFTRGFGGIFDSPSCSSLTWSPFGISMCTSSSPGDGMSDTADLIIS